MHAIRGTEGYTGSFGWGQSQPIERATVQEYLEDAYERRVAFRSIIEDFTKAAGSGITIEPPNVKLETSALRKLWDRTSSSVGKPEKINDYLRARILVPANPGDLAQFNDTMDLFMDHPLTVAYKDRIFRPNGSGFRALNGIMNIDGMHAELQIVPDDRDGVTREANRMTEGLRKTERDIRQAEERFDVSGDMIRRMLKLVSRAENTIGLIREFRKALHDNAANAAGVNIMMDPQIARDYKPSTEKDIVRIHAMLARDYFGRQLAIRLENPVKQILSRPSMLMPRAGSALQ